MKRVYLDSAATTQLLPEVANRMHQVLLDTYGNPSSTHSFGRSAKTLIETARKTIAKQLNALPQEIIFTSGGTEADNMGMRCAVRDLKVKTIITSKIEHHAVLHTAKELAEEYGIDLKFVSLQEDGNPNYEHLEQLLMADDTKKLVSLMHVNNEIGNILDIDRVAELCEKYNAFFHSDTVQSIGHFPLDLQRTKVHFLTAAAHKFHGPKGVGFAYIRKDSGLKPLIFGGSQERGFRAGTESVHNIVGLEEAFKIAYEHLKEDASYVMEIKQYFMQQLQEALPGTVFNGTCADCDNSTYTLVNARLPLSQEKSMMLLFHLELKGIACSKGSACQSGSEQGSHVLTEILSEEELKKPSVRFSFSKFNTKEDIDYTVNVLKEFAFS
ncbi:cysteine desulfurase family protein [Sungkyunkwania multivorans]|uniref:cysteine desulfurase n=1 Tax=Sungkyunkwania multivorans TaxID=1173618 RepID=A0ABW3CV48_9FLAO